MNPSFHNNQLSDVLPSWNQLGQGFMPDIPRVDDDDHSFSSSLLFVTSKDDFHTYSIRGASQTIEGSNWSDNTLIRSLYIGAWSKVC